MHIQHDGALTQEQHQLLLARIKELGDTGNIEGLRDIKKRFGRLNCKRSEDVEQQCRLEIERNWGTV